MSFGFGFGFPRRLTSGGGLSPSLYLDFVGTNSLPSTVTFSRGTNATLTNSNGLIAWAPHNLLTNSEDFEAAAWNKGAGVTVTANATIAPDLTTTADNVAFATGGAADFLRTLPAMTVGVVYTVSVYALLVSGTPTFRFDIGNSVGVPISAAQTPTTTWQRFSFTFTFAGANSWIDLEASGPGTIAFWGAQLNVANAPVNLLTWSEDFTNAAWGASATAINRTANTTTAPDGSLTADSATGDGTNALHYFGQAITLSATTAYTLSFYAKANGVNFVQVFLVGGTGYANFNITSGGGAVGTSGAPFSSLQIQDAGNGWYRCSCVVTNPANNDIYFSLSNSASATRAAASFATSGGIFIWGAQLNTGSVALPYVATTSSIFLPPTYNPTTPKNLLGFTQEPENAAWTKSNSYVQQNLLTWSQDFDNAAWAKASSGTGSAPVVTANAAIAPDGSQTAELVVFNRGAGNASADQSILSQASISTTISTNYAGSFYVKAATVSDIGKQLAFRHVASASYLIITLTADWQRITRTEAAGGVSSSFDIANRGTFTADNTVSAHLWGAQLVQGATAGDYTQTTSAAAPTRYTNWDGTLTGRKLVETTAASTVHQISQIYSGAVASGVYTFNVYLAKGERDKAVVIVSDNATGDCRVVVDLIVGTVGAPTVTGNWTTASATIQPASGGFFRVGITCTKSSAGNTSVVPIVGLYTTSASYTGDGTSGIYVSDFQLSNSASVDPYVYNPQAAAASAAYYGPRFDYDPVTLAAKGLLIEEQRTNLLTYSEQFDNAAWVKGVGGVGVAPAVTANQAVAPDGTTTADLVVLTNTGTTTSDFSWLYQNFSAQASTTYTYSVWVKASGPSEIGKVIVISGASGAITLATLTADWQRVTQTSATAGAGTISVGPRLRGTETTATTASIHLWGAQLEAGSFATSYVPTVASQVTRNADSASMLGDNFYTWYNPNQGTLSGEASRSALGGNSPIATVFSATNTRMQVGNNTGGGGTAEADFYVQNAGADQAWLRFASAVTANVPFKIVGAYNLNNFGASANGAATLTDPTGTVPVATSLLIGASGTAGNAFNGTIRRIGYYNTRLPNATLQALTT